MKRLQMNIPDELHRRLKVFCADTGQQMTEVVLRLIDEFLKVEMEETKQKKAKK